MDSFKNYLLQNKNVDFTFKGADYHIIIAGVDVFPQGYSAIASLFSQPQPSVQQAVIEESKPDENTATSLEFINGLCGK